MLIAKSWSLKSPAKAKILFIGQKKPISSKCHITPSTLDFFQSQECGNDKKRLYKLKPYEQLSPSHVSETECLIC